MKTVRIADLALLRIVSVDGRGGSGRTTAAARTPGATVVPTDDIGTTHSSTGPTRSPTASPPGLHTINRLARTPPTPAPARP